MKIEHRDVTLELIRGDIAVQPDLDAVVNAANAQLKIGGGVAGAIHRAAGPALQEECRPLAPIAPGEAVITGGHELPNRYVVHALGPVYGLDEPSDRLLADAYRNALRVADEKGVQSIGFPAISTGAFGFPVEPAAKIALSTCLAESPNLTSVALIRFILYSERDLTIHRDELTRQLRSEEGR